MTSRFTVDAISKTTESAVGPAGGIGLLVAIVNVLKRHRGVSAVGHPLV